MLLGELYFLLRKQKKGHDRLTIVACRNSVFADNGPRVTAEQIGAALQVSPCYVCRYLPHLTIFFGQSEPDLKQYVLERMPDGDYEKFTLDLFSR